MTTTPPSDSRLSTPTAAASAADAVADALTAPPYPVAGGNGPGVVTCGGGAYAYGAYVLVRMLRLVGFAGPVEVWHRGAAEPIDRRVFEDVGAAVVDSIAAAAAAGVTPPAGGWQAKTVAVALTRLDPVFFLDADAYTVDDPTPAFEDVAGGGEVFWQDTPGADANLDWAAVGLPPGSALVPPLNGGQWLVNKKTRAAELSAYARLNERADVLYRHMLGDQDCQRLAWHLLGRRPTLGSPRPPTAVGPCWLFPYRTNRPLVVHRIGSKMAPPGVFAANAFTGPVRGCPLEREAVRFFGEAVDRLGVPVGRPSVS